MKNKGNKSPMDELSGIVDEFFDPVQIALEKDQMEKQLKKRADKDCKNCHGTGISISEGEDDIAVCKCVQ